ncbi:MULTISPECIES: hypothetical protein [unclassified Brevibacterium]|uniref:hypothetical protein n=1 Tax=unclassified Brevibacterium TaxID=2614124 RepID=UPI001091ED14|nr:hypothetical protein [Brevibacterium sp. S22]TGD28902.1 hypothetical protein EB835_16880 [Brevibacterium sp. S22]
MEILREILLTLHLLGMAIIVGGYFTVIRSPKVMPGMLHGAYLQLLTGLLLMGVAEMGDGTVNHMKIGIKLVVAILVTVFAFIGNKKQKAFAASAPAESGAVAVKTPSATMAHLVVVFAVINVIVAVFIH